MKGFMDGLSRLGKKRAVIPDRLVNPDGINEYFVNSVPVVTGSVGPISYSLGSTCSASDAFSFSLVDIDVIVNVMGSIRATTVWCDGISIAMLRLCSPYIVP